MITASITLEQAKSHLRVTHEIDDAYIAGLIPTSFRLIADDIDRELTAPICLTLTGELSESLRHAALLVIGDLYQNREAQQTEQLHMNQALDRLLSKYRKLGL
ncbi:head-tail connector protein [Psychrobacter glaciei]|uniref:head-tail connector protein n=1 Tax=Psychrobacter glaciei TaxID=619771 RepID=UPI001F068162|nr:head-tail connector protein [Psychrobacter glaciei]MCH1781741.1 head-tail connector protein [Psychrobacter glaciei]